MTGDRYIPNGLGGAETAGALHRLCAILTMLYVVIHLGWLVYYYISARKTPLTYSLISG